MVDGSRGIGRTNQMLKAAVAAQREGKTLIIVGAHEEQLKMLKHRYMFFGGNVTNVHFVAGSNWEDRARGMSQSTVVFRDHYAVETFEREARQKNIELRAQLDAVQSKLRDIEHILA